MKLLPLVVVALLSLVFVETAHGFYLPGVAPQGTFYTRALLSFSFAAFFSLSNSLFNSIKGNSICGRPREIALSLFSRVCTSLALSYSLSLSKHTPDNT